MILKKGCMNIKKVIWNWFLCFSLERDFAFFLTLCDGSLWFLETLYFWCVIVQYKVPCGHVYSPTDCNIFIILLIYFGGVILSEECLSLLYHSFSSVNCKERQLVFFYLEFDIFIYNRYFEGFYIIFFSLPFFFNLVLSLMCPWQAKHYWDFYVIPIVNFGFISFLFFQLTEKKWMILVLSVLRRSSGPHMDNVDIVKSAPPALLVSGSFVMIAAVAFASLSPVLFLSPRLELWFQSYFACYKTICQGSFCPNYFVGMEKVMILVASDFNIVWCHGNCCTVMIVIFD